MPEGDTIYRSAAVLRRALLRQEVVAARGRPGAAQLQRTVGSHVSAVSARGKHLLIDFDIGLTLHTHLGMKGSWHRYRRGERWRRRTDEVVAVIETPTAVAVCFGAPSVELLETRALASHPVLARLGPDLAADDADIEAALARLTAPQRAELTIAEALLDQRAVAGIGNVYRSEVLADRSIDPFVTVRSLPRTTLRHVVETARQLLRANLDGGVRLTMPDAMGAPPGATAGSHPRAQRRVYGRAGQPCRRCRTIIASTLLGRPPRRVYWCPTCQAGSEP